MEKTDEEVLNDPNIINLCVKNFKPKVGKKISFSSCMKKIKTSVESTMRRRKKIRIGNKKKINFTSAPWMD